MYTIYKQRNVLQEMFWKIIKLLDIAIVIFIVALLFYLRAIYF